MSRGWALVLVGAAACAEPVPVESAHAWAEPDVVAQENTRPGTEAWRLDGPAVEREIEGFFSASSVNLGEAVDLFVSTADPSYRLELYRMGWYGGLGGRLVAVSYTHLTLP